MTQDQLTKALAYVQENQARFLEELKAFVSIPSISTDPTAKPHIQRAAQWITDQLRSLGMQNVRIFPTQGHPIVYGELLTAGAEKPTVLIYGHYDVQPAEPIELWESPAFEPTQRGDNLFGRGASDMKGQIVITMKAAEALIRTGGLPINLKFLIEGEEEIGSPNLEKFIAEHKEMLACDFALNTDTGMIGAETPTITYGLRGLAYFELRVYGPKQDLHSGIYGGSIHNPAQALCELIAGMHDHQGKITLPGFYDSVRSLSEEERAELARLPMGEDFYREQTGVPVLHGEANYSSTERWGAPYPGSQRLAFRLHRRGNEDRTPLQGDGKDIHATGARPGSERSLPTTGSLPGDACAAHHPLGSDGNGGWSGFHHRPADTRRDRHAPGIRSHLGKTTALQA